MGLNRPHTAEEIANLKAKAEERWERERAKKKTGSESQGAPAAGDPSKAVPNAGGAPGGDIPAAAGAGGGAGGGTGDDGIGGGNGGAPVRANPNRKIPKKKKELEIVLDQDAFLSGLPALIKIYLGAAFKVITGLNFLPMPFRIEFEPMTQEETQAVSEAVKPGMKKIMPWLGAKHPIWTMVSVGIATAIKKVKFVWTGFKKPKPVMGTVSQPAGQPGEGQDE